MVYFKCVYNVYCVISVLLFGGCMGPHLVGLRASSGLLFCTTHRILIFLYAMKVKKTKQNKTKQKTNKQTNKKIKTKQKQLDMRPLPRARVKLGGRTR